MTPRHTSVWNRYGLARGPQPGAGEGADDRRRQHKSKVPGEPTHSNCSFSVADNLTCDLCDNIKDDVVQLYNVAFDTSGSGESILRNCASDHSKAFAHDTGAQLNADFHSIASPLSKLRVTN
jgi:hypothetical protein